ncbi:aminotransferase class V-fold PLP-dependent enzyme [Kiloniella sp.]|uniref:aminotransferase class V-fold PLP-dependent enzyme n=2 Tax=Kiloniella sp. TaxID=1938587 RepID=UPI003B025BF4
MSQPAKVIVAEQLGQAIDYALQIGVKNIEERISDLSQYFRNELSNIPSISLLDLGDKKCGIVSFYSDQKKCTEIRAFLETNQIHVSTPGRTGNPVLFDQCGISQLVRASVHYFNTKEEIDKMVDLLKTFLRA